MLFILFAFWFYLNFMQYVIEEEEASHHEILFDSSRNFFTDFITCSIIPPHSSTMTLSLYFNNIPK